MNTPMSRVVSRGISTSRLLLGSDSSKKKEIKVEDPLMAEVLEAQINAYGNSKKLPPTNTRFVIADHEIKSPVYEGLAKSLGYKTKNGFQLP